MSDWIEMTKEEAVAKHRKLWNEIADMLERGERYDHTDTLKEKALHNIGENNDIYNKCYCCEYTRKNCLKCPIIWNNNSRNNFMCETGEDYYDTSNSEWLNFWILIKERDYDLAAEVARDIANLPERKEI